MASRLKILAIASWYPSPNEPRMGNFVQRHLQAIARQHQLVVISAFEGESTSLFQSKEHGFEEIQVQFVKKLPLYSYLRALQFGYKKAIEKHQKFDLCHLHVGYPAGLMALKTKLPFIITEHFSGYQPKVNFKWSLMQKKLSQKIIRKAQHLTPVTSQLGKSMNHFAKSEVPVTPISNVVDTTIFKPADRPGDLAFTFLHISTLEEKSKNITGILNGFKKLEETGRKFILQIGGDGDLEDLKSKIQAAGLRDNSVQIIPPQGSTEIARLMQQANALVMFSHYENQPCTILESLCCGTPVVSSSVGGIADVLNSENGILVEAENGAHFVQSLTKIMDNYQRFNRAEIASKAEARFSPQAILAQFNKVYASVLS